MPAGADPGGERYQTDVASSFIRAVVVGVAGTGLSRVAGLLRDVAISSALGAGESSDAFNYANTIRDTFRKFVADEGLTGALVPAVARAEQEEGTEAARTLADRVLTALLLANGVVILGATVLARPIAIAMAPGYADDPEMLGLTVGLIRVMMPILAMISVASFAEGLLNHRRHFFVPKVAPGLMALGMAGAVTAYATWDTTDAADGLLDRTAYALAGGAWLGGLLYVGVHAPVLKRLWGMPRLRAGLSDPRLRGVLRELGKVVAIGLFAQVNVLLLRQLGSFMTEGSITRYTNATRLVDFAQGLIAVAIASALLPDLSSAVAAADWDRFRADLARGLRLTAFLLLPASVGVAAYALPLTAMVFFGGLYTWDDVQITASGLQLMAPFMLAVAGINVLKKVFFALEDRNALLGVGAVGVALTGGVGWALLDREVAGLALALSVATVAQLGIYVVLLRRRLGDRMPLGPLGSPLARMALATVPMGLFAGWVAMSVDWQAGRSLGSLGAFAGGLAGSAVIYAAMCGLLGVEELTWAVGAVRARLGRRR